jgi:hypothetical protein
MRLKLVRPAPLLDMCSQAVENAAIAKVWPICFVSDGKREETGFSGPPCGRRSSIVKFGSSRTFRSAASPDAVRWWVVSVARSGLL